MAKKSRSEATTKHPANDVDPTAAQMNAYRAMYDYFNRELFGGQLRPVMLNFSRKARALGFFAPERWGSGPATTHEISLNPSYLALRPAKDTASTLVHEMAHCWQQEHGDPGRGGYHNAEWATKMEAIGLMPSDTGLPGGRKTGDRMTHYIIPGGAFDRAFEAMPREFLLPWSSSDEEKARSKSKRSKVKYSCPTCEANAWAKPRASLMCGECEEHMVAEPLEAEEDQAA